MTEHQLRPLTQGPDACFLNHFTKLLAESGDDPDRYADARSRKNYAGTSLRQLANRLVGILHGCLKTGTTYDEATAWSHRRQDTAA